MAASPPQGQPPAALGLAGACAVLSLPILNPDIFWHLSAARWILAHGAVPRADWLSWTSSGKPWADFEWGAQLAFAGAHAAFGPAGLWALKAIVLGSAGAAMAGVLSLHGLGRAARAWAVFAWALSIAPGNDIRPENFSLLLLMLLWLLLESRRLGRISRARAGAVSAAIAGLFALWSNVHAAFPVGLLLLAAYSLREPRRVWELPLAAAAALANPYGAEVYRLAAVHAKDMAALRGNIQEWGPPALKDPWMLPAWGLMAAAACAGAARFAGRVRGVIPWHGVLVGIFAGEALAHARMVPYFACFGVPYVALAARSLGSRPGRGVFWAAAAALSAFAAWKPAPVLALREVARFGSMPRLAADFLERESVVLGPLRMLNPWGWGGYLGWRLSPGYRVYCDGRYIFHPLIEPEAAARARPQDYARFLDEREISLVVLTRTRQTAAFPGEGAASLRRPLYSIFLPPKSWALVHWDSHAMVFVRRAAAPEKWLEPKELRLMRPDDEAAVAESLRSARSAWARAREEARRLPSAAEDPEAAAEVSRLLAEVQP